MASTPPAACPTGYPLGVNVAGLRGGGHSHSHSCPTGSLLDASPTSSCYDNNSVGSGFPGGPNANANANPPTDPTGQASASFLSSQSCDVVMQTGSLGRRGESRYKQDTRQVNICELREMPLSQMDYKDLQFSPRKRKMAEEFITIC